MIRKKRLYFICFMISLCVISYAQNKNEKNDKNNSQFQRAQSTAYIEALNQKIQENYDDAIQLFETILKQYPADHASMYELSEIYAIKREFPLAIKWGLKATELDPNNDWYFLQLADIYIENNENQKATVILERLCKKKPENMEYVENLAMAYMAMEEYDKAIRQLNVIEEQQGVSETLSMQKFKIFKILGKDKKATAELEKLIKRFPHETRYYTLLANAYLQSNMKKEALQMYNKILEIDPQDPYIHIALADFYRQEGNLNNAIKELKLGFSNSNLDFKTKMQLVGALMQISHESNNMLKGTEIKEILQSIIDAHPNEPEAWQLYADLLLQEKNYREAQQVLSKIVASDSSHYTTWEMLLYTDHVLNDFKSMAQHASSATRLFPLQPIPYMSGGVANFQLSNYAKAIQLLEHGKDFVFDNPNMLEDFHIMLGDCYHQLNNEERCFFYYEKVLQSNPNNALILNNYAYYLSLSGKELDKAKKMSYESLRLDANNPNNMDTYGWVLYKQGRYNDAALWIKKALEKSPASNTLYDHYGDVLYKQGKVEEAVTYWKKAKESEGEPIKWLDKKINERKLYED